MSDLILPVKKEYFDQMKSGEKPEEYRLDNEYWRKRLAGKTYDRVIVTLGYPKKDDESLRLVFPWQGYVSKMITHKHFGEKPVAVFAIKVTR